MVSEGVIDPAKLPPTQSAAIQHGKRVRLQVMTWKMLDDSCNLENGDGKMETDVLYQYQQQSYIFLIFILTKKTNILHLTIDN